jgi:enoyl-CoA hydratase/carnithine racemase
MTQPFNYETVSCTKAAPHVLQVTLNRPQVGNALNTQMGRDLLDLWNRLAEDAGEVRCIVLTGAGEKIF